MTPEQLQAIHERAERATPGPWAHITWDLDTEHAVIGPEPRETIAMASYVYPECTMGLDEDDAEFIAHAREDIPTLLAEIERLEALLEAGRRSAR